MGNLSIFLNHPHFKVNQLLVSEGQIIAHTRNERRNSLKPRLAKFSIRLRGSRGKTFNWSERRQRRSDPDRRASDNQKPLASSEG